MTNIYSEYNFCWNFLIRLLLIKQTIFVVKSTNMRLSITDNMELEFAAIKWFPGKASRGLELHNLNQHFMKVTYL